MTTRALLRLLLVTAGVLLVQATVGLDVSIHGIHPDLLLLVPVSAGLVAGPEQGAIAGFVAGLGADLLLPTPFGLSALVGCVLGFVAGILPGGLVRQAWWWWSGVALVGSAAAVMLYAVLGAVLGQDQFLHVDLPGVVAMVAVTDAVLAAPAVAVQRWALQSRGAASGTTVAGGRW